MKNKILSLIAIVSAFAPNTFAASAATTAPKLIELKSPGLPITVFNLTFRVGSADDPKGAEGLAHMTARMVREGGVSAFGKLPARTRAELEDYLFPLAADIGVSAAKEQTSFQVTSSAADSETVFDVLSQLILAPAFDQAEFERLKAETLDALKKQLPREDQEELGKAALDRMIFGADHPYGHLVAGSVAGVESLNVEKVREFYKKNYSQSRLTVGVAGVINSNLSKKLKTVFASLEKGDATRATIPAAASLTNTQLRLTLVKGPFDATGVHLGQALGFNRASPDYSRMYLASLAFGKHRSFVGRLMHEVREVRGLNYGTYSYVEDFPAGGSHLSEPTQVARQRQAFTIWARPTTLPNGCFLLRQVYREAVSLAEKGLSAEEFKLGQSHLVGNAPLLATGLERRLGYAIDSEFYGIKGDYLMKLQREAKTAKREQVNSLLAKNLKPKTFEIVVVTPSPEKFKEEILSSQCEIHYGEGIEKPAEVRAEDKLIGGYSLGLHPDNIQIVDSESLFQK